MQNRTDFRPNRNPEFLALAIALTMGIATAAASPICAADKLGSAAPLRLHPENPRYFLFRGRPAVLITSGEHYGAVLNLDFDTVRYLDALRAHGFNLTRAFSGTYREVPGSFGITGNTLAPAPGRFICPWARAAVPGEGDLGPRFDLGRWDSAYFDRLKDFVAQAGKRGIVVEVVLFCTMYDDAVWNASPMNARNNVNGIGGVGRNEVHGGRDPDLLAAQEAVTRKIVAELSGLDNVYFEVCNEPYERSGLTREWNDRIIAAIRQAESPLSEKHLIAQGFPPASAPIADLNPHVSVLNFHAATPDCVRLNYHWKRVIAYDETGGSDRSDRKYRADGWEFILSGGGVYDHLDFSFTPDREDGTAVPLPPGTPGGGGPDLRRQLRILKEFIEGFDFVKMAPLDAVKGEFAGPPSGAPPEGRPRVRALAEPGKAYAVYANGGTAVKISLDLPAGAYRAEWLNPRSGAVERAQDFEHAGGSKTLASPPCSEDIALRVKRVR